MSSALRKKIRQCARSLFMKEGYETVGMRQIAQAFGLQPTQVYRLELSKADILAEVIIELNSELIDTLPALLDTVYGKTALVIQNIAKMLTANVSVSCFVEIFRISSTG